MAAAEPIVLIAGNDVVAGTGGHPSYVRAHARAARRAGFAPQLFSLSRADGTVETDYGTVHQVGVRVGFERGPCSATAITSWSGGTPSWRAPWRLSSGRTVRSA